MIETVLLALLIAGLLLAWRQALRAARRAWGALRWWERALLLVCCLPIPGPQDEIVGGWLIARGLRRASKLALAPSLPLPGDSATAAGPRRPPLAWGPAATELERDKRADLLLDHGRGQLESEGFEFDGYEYAR